MSGHWSDLIWALSFTTFLVWLLASIAIDLASLFGGNPERLAKVRALRAELRPFALPALLLSYAAQAFGDGLNPWGYAGLALNLYNWWHYYRRSDDDDDRWKRRRQKLADKVAEVGGKLQVVPAMSPP